MSTIIAAKALRYQDLFELSSGSVYETATHGASESPIQARLWCAHAPDSSTFAPPLIDLLPEQQVHLLSRNESRGHVGHAGYVRAVFEHEMARQHEERMGGVYAKINQDAAATRLRERANRPWWKKVFS